MEWQKTGVSKKLYHRAQKLLWLLKLSWSQTSFKTCKNQHRALNFNTVNQYWHISEFLHNNCQILSQNSYMTENWNIFEDLHNGSKSSPKNRNISTVNVFSFISFLKLTWKITFFPHQSLITRLTWIKNCISVCSV